MSLLACCRYKPINYDVPQHDQPKSHTLSRLPTFINMASSWALKKLVSNFMLSIFNIVTLVTQKDK